MLDESAKATALLRISDLRVHFRGRAEGLGRRRAMLKAVDGVSIEVPAARTYGLVGESGCGKSTLATTILLLQEPLVGRIELAGIDPMTADKAELLLYRRTVQAVFQDPFSSMNPRMRIRDIVGEPIDVHLHLPARERIVRIRRLLEDVGLPSGAAELFPHEFSGGQRQRVAIARALSVGPKFVILDEAVSALDVSIRAQVMNLLLDVQQEHGLAYLFIAHDIAVVSFMSDTIGVMYLGRIVEEAGSQEIVTRSLHPYTRALIAAALPLEGAAEEIVLGGEVPSPLEPPPGCHFHPRCPFALKRCAEEDPAMVEVAPGHRVACFLHSDEVATPRDGPARVPRMLDRLLPQRFQSGRVPIATGPGR